MHVSGSAISVPDRQVSGSGGNLALGSILVLFLAVQLFARIAKGMGVNGGGGFTQFVPIRTDRK